MNRNVTIGTTPETTEAVKLAAETAISGLNNRFVEKRENRNYLSKSSSAASAVIRTMLNEPRREWQVVTLCHESGKAMGTIGSFSAAARYAPTVRYMKVDVYVEPQCYDEFIRDLELQPVNSGGNAVITIPHDETPLMYAREINGSFVTSPVQTVIDLLGSASRGEEAADAIILKEFTEGEYD